MRLTSFQTPSFGEVSIATIEGDADVLCAVEFGPISLIQKRFPHLVVEKVQASSIVMGKVFCTLERGDEYTDKISMIGTDFQVSVWRALQLIPYGQIVSYKEVAEEIGRPAAVRAVGKAVGANPLAVIVPCHRVLGKNNPEAYHWGWDIKRKLLDKEYLATHPMEIILS